MNRFKKAVAAIGLAGLLYSGNGYAEENETRNSQQSRVSGIKTKLEEMCKEYTPIKPVQNGRRLFKDYFPERLFDGSKPTNIREAYCRGPPADEYIEGGRFLGYKDWVIQKPNGRMGVVRPSVWNSYYFDVGKKGEGFRDIIKRNSRLKFDDFDNFMHKYRDDFFGLTLVTQDDEGYLMMGFSNSGEKIAITLPFDREVIEAIRKY